MSRWTIPCASAAARARRLLHDLERTGERHRSLAADALLERFALDQLHDVKALALLLAVVSDAGDVWMMYGGGAASLQQDAMATHRRAIS